jgi:hypothetical protein
MELLIIEAGRSSVGFVRFQKKAGRSFFRVQTPQHEVMHFFFVLPDSAVESGEIKFLFP